jgi:ATP citrate (pro-S)-lyase
MAQRAIREHDGKRMLARLLPDYAGGLEAAAANGIALSTKSLLVAREGGRVDWDAYAAAEPWVLSERLVVKPDQLIKRRGKGGLLLLNADWTGVQKVRRILGVFRRFHGSITPLYYGFAYGLQWVEERMGRDTVVDGVRGVLSHFIVEPFVPHKQEDEYYVCIQSEGGRVI